MHYSSLPLLAEKGTNAAYSFHTLILAPQVGIAEVGGTVVYKILGVEPYQTIKQYQLLDVFDGNLDHPIPDSAGSQCRHRAITKVSQIFSLLRIDRKRS